MKKTAFKTFVCSFVFSLFAILLTNRAYLRTPKADNNDIKISGKNITLFLKNDELAPISLASMPTKKIVLSTVADISKKEDIHVDNIEPLSQDNASENVAENHFENSDKAALPVQVLKKEEIPAQPEAKVFADTNAAPSDKQADAQQTIALNQPLVQDTMPRTEDISDEENTLIDIKIPLEQSNTKKIAASEPKAIPASTESIAKEVNKEADKLAEEIKTAQADISPVVQEEKEPQILIPLENSQKKLWAKAEIKTAAEANKNQVALNSKNIPISSMDAKKHDLSAPASKTNDKAWKSMKEKYGSQKADDPWVVAKGKKFPDNQLLLDEKKYKISDEEVQKIFEANKALSSNNEEENIQLASKTVKNLLIPIPEDILNDENLTPQLISSPKNQEIKEELEAKGLIRKEEAEEESKEDKEVTSTSASTQTPSADTTTKDGSILDSLTSFFAGNKTTTPEIGVNEDDEEDTNTLFSAFTRKQNRLMSKILPTEIRLSFQPNRAEISGQTLKWIKAFAQKTAEEPSTGLEIRIDGTSSPLLQRRRLNLLQNILLNEGAEPEKINTVFTAREPNSFILRTVRINKERINTPAKNNNRYMQW